MLLINCKVHLELNWIKDWILFSAGDSAKFKTADAKLHVSVVTLNTKDKLNLKKKKKKQLSDGFKRPTYWSQYQTILQK